MNDNPKVDSQHTDYDLYASLMLYNLLDSEEVTATNEPIIEEKSIEDINNDVIWVPADKHPEIAPIEFANFIKTHGANTPTRRSSSLHRKKSILSQSLTSSNGNSLLKDRDQDDEQLNRTLSEKKRLFLKKVLANSEQLRDINTQVFDRNSTATDDSRIIVPRADRSLLRRSAFSARGRSRKHGHVEDRQQLAEKRRSVSQRKPSASHSMNDSIKSTKTNDSWDKSQGVSLFDQPVNLSEWIDLGSASLESDDSQRGILSRVHDAESQLRSQIDNDNSLEEHEQEEKCVITDDPAPTTNQPDVTLEMNNSNATGTTAKAEGMKRPEIIRSEPEKIKKPLSKVVVTKSEKKSSWLGGFFNDKKNNAATKKTSSTVITTSTNSPLSGFASLFTRSLSMKSSQLSHSSTNNRNSAKPKPGKVNTNQAKSPTITSTTTTTTTTTTITTTAPNTNNNTLTDTKKKRSSRLEIPPPSERTFFNSNRLPLHVERAIYRLSHMKLADPRRPLHQQVLISNLMFWYLSIQQNDFQQVNTEQRVEIDSPPVPDTQQKKGGKMSRLIHSAKRRRNEVAQFVLSNNHQQENPSRPPLRQSNVQFSLPPIPSHQSILTDDIEEEDNVPLSHYRS